MGLGRKDLQSRDGFIITELHLQVNGLADAHAPAVVNRHHGESLSQRQSDHTVCHRAELAMGGLAGPVTSRWSFHRWIDVKGMLPCSCQLARKDSQRRHNQQPDRDPALGVSVPRWGQIGRFSGGFCP